jgi:hypothetical protein
MPFMISKPPRMEFQQSTGQELFLDNMLPLCLALQIAVTFVQRA